MKVVKIILLVAGLIALVVGAFMLFMTVMVHLKVVWEIATRYATTTDLIDPRHQVFVITAIALGAGILIGLGLGLPLQLAPSEKKLDALVEARVQQRLSAPAAPVTPEPGYPSEPV